MLLSTEERVKFAAWCNQSAASDTALAVQMELIMPQLARIYRAKAAAAKMIERLLLEVEEQTIKKG